VVVVTEPALTRHHLHPMNAYDVATLCDLSGYPGWNLGVFLSCLLSGVCWKRPWNMTPNSFRCC
jgi:hypothetical protein